VLSTEIDASVFDPALSGAASRLVRDDGAEVDLAVRRWRRTAGGEDRWLLDRCTGPAIDLGCGPGRLVAALAGRGVRALGVDSSAVAQRLCRRRRTPMVRSDVFGPLPGEGTWGHVLLADGNIGIGGDPHHLLSRVTRLLRPGGSVLVEADAEPDLLWRGTVRMRTVTGTGDPLPWASAGADALDRLGVTLGLRRTACYRGVRSFVELTVSGPVAAPGAAAAG
jgi:SAM-dependent methyltransferase